MRNEKLISCLNVIDAYLTWMLCAMLIVATTFNCVMVQVLQSYFAYI